MLKKVKAKIRRRKIKKAIKEHGLEILGGLVLGLLTDVITDVVQARMRKSILKKLR